MNETSSKFNFAEFVFETNHQNAERVAFVDHHGDINYNELEQLTHGLAANLSIRGVRQGHHVMVSRHDDRFTVMAFLACMLMGAVPIMVHGRCSKDYFQRCLEQTSPDWIIAGEHTLDWSRTTGTNHIIDTADLENMSSPGSFEAAATLGSDPGYCLFTSGTTGHPRPVVHSHENLRAVGILYGRNTDGMTQCDRVYATARLSFAYGICHSLASTLISGATAILTTKLPTPESVLQTVRHHHPTIFVTVPSVYAMLLKTGTNISGHGIKQCVSAGEDLSVALQKKWQDFTGIPLLNVYGCTEFSGAVLANHLHDMEIGTVGRPTEGYTCELRDTSGNTVQPGMIGELWAKGPSLALTAQTNTNANSAWFRSHDLFYQNSQGRFVFQGRSDDTFKVHGQWVSPVEIEAVIIQLEDISEVGVCGCVDTDGLVEIIAHVVPMPHAKINEHKVRAYVRQHLDYHKCPKHIRIVKELPRTINGKLQRSHLKMQTS